MLLYRPHDGSKHVQLFGGAGYITFSRLFKAEEEEKERSWAAQRRKLHKQQRQHRKGDRRRRSLDDMHRSSSRDGGRLASQSGSSSGGGGGSGDEPAIVLRRERRREKHGHSTSSDHQQKQQPSGQLVKGSCGGSMFDLTPLPPLSAQSRGDVEAETPDETPSSFPDRASVRSLPRLNIEHITRDFFDEHDDLLPPDMDGIEPTGADLAELPILGLSTEDGGKDGAEEVQQLGRRDPVESRAMMNIMSRSASWEEFHKVRSSSRSHSSPRGSPRSPRVSPRESPRLSPRSSPRTVGAATAGVQATGAVAGRSPRVSPRESPRVTSKRESPRLSPRSSPRTVGAATSGVQATGAVAGRSHGPTHLHAASQDSRDHSPRGSRDPRDPLRSSSLADAHLARSSSSLSFIPSFQASLSPQQTSLLFDLIAAESDAACGGGKAARIHTVQQMRSGILSFAVDFMLTVGRSMQQPQQQLGGTDRGAGGGGGARALPSFQIPVTVSEGDDDNSTAVGGVGGVKIESRFISGDSDLDGLCLKVDTFDSTGSPLQGETAVLASGSGEAGTEAASMRPNSSPGGQIPGTGNDAHIRAQVQAASFESKAPPRTALTQDRREPSSFFSSHASGSHRGALDPSASHSRHHLVALSNSTYGAPESDGGASGDGMGFTSSRSAAPSSKPNVGSDGMLASSSSRRGDHSSSSFFGSLMYLLSFSKGSSRSRSTSTRVAGGGEGGGVSSATSAAEQASKAKTSARPTPPQEMLPLTLVCSHSLAALPWELLLHPHQRVVRSLCLLSLVGQVYSLNPSAPAAEGVGIALPSPQHLLLAKAHLGPTWVRDSDSLCSQPTTLLTPLSCFCEPFPSPL